MASRLAASPLGLGALAASAGAVLAAVIPTTRHEEDMLGETASRLRETSMDLAGQLVESGGNVLAEASEAARDHTAAPA